MEAQGANFIETKHEPNIPNDRLSLVAQTEGIKMR